MSVLLDTNVVSELICKAPDPAVEAWTAGHALEGLFFSTVCEAELRNGAVILSAGRRRESLVSDIERMLSDAFDGACCRSARAYADIAAIARSRDMVVATRNVRDFDDIDIEIVNPWTAA